MSFKLPISVVRHPDGQLTLRESKSMLYPTIFNLREKGMLNFYWIGWPGIIPKNEEEKELIQQLLKP
jgi:trehalose-6-phosphate synthase